MSADKQRELERLEDLLIERALEGLDNRDAQELSDLCARHPEVSTDGYEELTADLHLAQMEGPLNEVPTLLMDQLQDQADQFFEDRSDAPVVQAKRADQQPGQGKLFAISGWLAAAASLLLAFSLYTQKASAPPSTAEARATLMASAEDLVQVDWTATEDELVKGLAIGGNVVWSDEADEGYMTFRGFTVNDPTQTQYQLWIFDKERSAEQPVDGGVFDITSNGEVIIPIDSRLPVSEAFLFGITVEQPGGVVVSSREHLVLVASL